MLACCKHERAQMGRGRTTTGMIIATMLLLRQRTPKLQLLSHKQGTALCVCFGSTRMLMQPSNTVCSDARPAEPR